MGRLPLVADEGLIYHASNRGNNRDDVFADDGDLEAFLEAQGRTRSRYPLRLLGYCLTSNHFHLLLHLDAGPSISLSQGIIEDWARTARDQPPAACPSEPTAQNV